MFVDHAAVEPGLGAAAARGLAGGIADLPFADPEIELPVMLAHAGRRSLRGGLLGRRGQGRGKQRGKDGMAQRGHAGTPAFAV